MSIADIVFRMTGLPGAALDMVRRRYAAFEVEGNDAAAVWELDMDGPEPGWPARAGDATAVRVAHGAGGVHEFTMNDVQAAWDPAAGRGRARVAMSEYAVDGLLRVWLSGLLLRTAPGGGLFHAAGAVRGRTGYLFAGRSGTGKSTLAATCGAHELLSDELVAVRRTGASYHRVYGTPFMGELGIGGRNISAPLRRFFLLDHTAAPGLAPVSRARAASELWGTLLCFDNSAADAALALCGDMASALPCRRLSFDRKHGPWRLLDAG